MKYILFFILFCTSCDFLFAQQTPIVLKTEHDLLLIGKQAPFFEDKEGKMTIDDITNPALQNKFQENDKIVFARPATRSAFWFKIILQNHCKEDAWLEVGTTYAWYIDFYAPDAQGKYKNAMQTGTMRPEANKLYDVNLFWLPLNKAEEKTTKIYYIRIKEALTFELPLQVGTIRSLSINKDVNDYLTAGFIGLLIIMLLYNSFLYISTKDNIYGLYIGYLFLMAIAMPYANGYPFIEGINFLFLDKAWWNNYFLLWHPPVYFFVGAFCINYLNLNKNKGKWAKRIILTEVITLSLVFPLLTLFGMPLVDLVTSFQGILLIFYLTCLFTSYYFAFKGDKQARYYALGWTFMIVCAFVFFAVINGLLPFNPFSRNTLYFGVALEVWMFSLALGDRMNVIRREKEFAQAENLRLVKEQNFMLEEKVLERTKNLQEAQDRIMAQNEELQQQHEELESVNDVLRNQKNDIEEKNRHIMASIAYAQRIQQAILPVQEDLNKAFPEHFIFYKPRDVVSGDFYWYAKEEDLHILAMIDCTGHGVPGAFMTLIAHDLLNEIVKVRKIYQPDLVLNELRARILQELRQKESGNQDGLEISFCVVDYKQDKPIFYYASNCTQLIYIQNNTLNTIKSDLIIVGGFRNYLPNTPFTLHTIPIDSPTTFYMYSDGYQDQFGGAERKKFGTPRLKKLFYEIHNNSIQKQKELVVSTLEHWMEEGTERQIDDILVLGIKIGG